MCPSVCIQQFKHSYFSFGLGFSWEEVWTTEDASSDGVDGGFSECAPLSRTTSVTQTHGCWQNLPQARLREEALPSSSRLSGYCLHHKPMEVLGGLCSQMVMLFLSKRDSPDCSSSVSVSVCLSYLQSLFAAVSFPGPFCLCWMQQRRFVFISESLSEYNAE